MIAVALSHGPVSLLQAAGAFLLAMIPYRVVCRAIDRAERGES